MPATLSLRTPSAGSIVAFGLPLNVLCHCTYTLSGCTFMSTETNQLESLPVSLEDIRAAARRIEAHVSHTPVLRCESLERELGVELFFKGEHLQEAGAFKSRGACNAVFSLDDSEACRGVLTHSSGNHAAALSRAAQRRGIPAFIVMPQNAPATKVQRVREYGGQITFCESTLAARESQASELLEETGATFIHPYDDERIIAGQGTAMLELLNEQPQVDSVITPVGGGGLLSGTLITAKSLRPDLKVWAAEPHGADDAYRSWQSGRLIPQHHPNTIADGLRTSLGQRNFAIIRQLVDNIVLVSDDSIRNTVVQLWREASWQVEPSGVVPLAALLSNKSDLPGRRIGVILSGGNVDIESFIAADPSL